MSSQIETQIRAYLLKNVLYSDDDRSVANDTPLLASGIIDSIGIMELVDFVSDSFALEIPMKDIHQDNFDSIEKLSNYVRKRRGQVSSNPGGAPEVVLESLND